MLIISDMADIEGPLLFYENSVFTSFQSIDFFQLIFMILFYYLPVLQFERYLLVLITLNYFYSLLKTHAFLLNLAMANCIFFSNCLKLFGIVALFHDLPSIFLLFPLYFYIYSKYLP